MIKLEKKMNLLKACPHCGSIDHIRLIGNEGYACMNCNDILFPLDEWNYRPIEDALQARLDKAKEFIKKIDNIAPPKNYGHVWIGACVYDWILSEAHQLLKEWEDK